MPKPPVTTCCNALLSGRDMSNCYLIKSVISEALPEESELVQTRKMVDTLKSYGIFEDELELKHREKVIGKLESLFQAWVKETCVTLDLPDIIVSAARGKIFPFGSYHLGAHIKGADMDALCVGPAFLDRKEFFTSFYETLKSQKEVKDVQALEQVYVPVIKLTYDGIKMDLVYARSGRRSVTDRITLLDDGFLKGKEKNCVRSVNGFRVTEEILRSVPNVLNFQLVLRTIKLWAKRRGIYSNIHGYLGGVSWAILVAKICQLYPLATASTLVNKFFKVYNMWTWPTPVALERIVHQNSSFTVWDPRLNPRVHYPLMHIITPAFPWYNSSANMSRSALTIMKEEFKRGFTVTEEIKQNKARWSELFKSPNFLDQYKHYVVLEATPATKQQHLDWVGFIESKIRHLVEELERNMLVSHAHINLETFPTPESEDGKKNSCWLIGLAIDSELYEYNEVNLSPQIEAFSNQILTMAESIGLLKEGMTISAKYLQRENQSWVEPNEEQRLRNLANQRRYLNMAVRAEEPVIKRKASPVPETPAKRIRAEQPEPENELCDLPNNLSTPAEAVKHIQIKLVRCFK